MCLLACTLHLGRECNRLAWQEIVFCISLPYKMRRTLYIPFLALLVTLFFSVTAMPHHHHRGVFCLEVEYCDVDELPNDTHTDHSGDSTHCLDYARGLTLKGPMLQLKDWSTSLMPVGLFDEYRLRPLLSYGRCYYAERSIPSITLLLVRPRGRRGPPSLL